MAVPFSFTRRINAYRTTHDGAAVGQVYYAKIAASAHVLKVRLP
jgi:hypothetical protein